MSTLQPNDFWSQQRSNVSSLCFQTDSLKASPNQNWARLSSLPWRESGPLPESPAAGAQLSSPIIAAAAAAAAAAVSAAATTTTTASPSTYANTNANANALLSLSLTQHPGSPAEATDTPTPANTAGVVSHPRDRRVARQAAFILGDSSGDPSFGQHHQHHRQLSPSPLLQPSTSNPGSRPTSSSRLRPSPISSARNRHQHRQARHRITRLKPHHLHQICDPRYCCLHYEPQLTSLSFHPLPTDHHFGTPEAAEGRTVPDMESEDPHDIAAQQAAAKDYQPAHDTPLVGNKLPCENITNEYAKADPIYVEKTLALPQTYSEYRPVRGDGNCGWRAIGFSYFEKLAEQGHKAKIESEFTRLTAYNQLLESVGDYNYWEDFAEPAMELLTDLASMAGNTEASLAIVFERWNDENITNAIIYYLRLLAATYLKEHAAEYDPFVPSGQGVQGHCETVIQPVNLEIEHLGILALSNLLLKPIGVVLEIAYLDRSEGSTVNQYRFPEEANGQDAAALGPMVYLLYRPDHYDILYQAKTQSSSMSDTGGLVYQVNRVELMPVNLNVDNTPAISNGSGMSDLDFGILSSLVPGIFDVNQGGVMESPNTNNTLSDTFAAQHSPWSSQYEEGMSVASSMVPPSSTAGVSTNPSTPMTPGSSSNTTGATNMAALGGQSACGTGTTADCQIRFSNAQYDYDGISDQFQVQTSTFKNSVYNTAHYRNPNFQPEECRPDGEFSEKRSSGKKKKRSDP